MNPTGFEFQLRTRLVFGVNTIERVGELARDLDAQRVLLVTDPGIVAAGHASRVRALLEAAGLSVVSFDRVEENPTTRTVDECVAVARGADVKLIIGLGGGSSLDTAKGCNFLLTNGGRMQDYRGYAKAAKPMLPMIAIPTTAGTGSEVQSYALIADAQTHQKMACGDPKAAPRVAILDPVLTLTQPPHVTADTGMDAVAHAVESAVTTKRNEMSWLFSRDAFRLTATHLPLVLSHPRNIEARAAMQLGAAYAGLAIEHSMLGAAHSAANPLTAHYGIVHGRAVGMMLPHVVKFNAAVESAAAAYRDLTGEEMSPEEAARTLVMRIEAWLIAAGIPRTLSAYQVPRSALPKLAEEAAHQWTAQFNPRPVTVEDFEELYRAAY